MGTNSAAESGAARRFWTYWGASTVGSVGDAVTSVALPLTAVTVLHAGALQVGLLAAATWVPWLVIGLPAGVVVGRLPLRGTQIAMDVARAVVLVSVPVAWWLDRLSFVQLLAAAVLVGFGNVVFSIGSTTFLPTVVPRTDLQRRNSLMSATGATTQMGGPSLGGLLVQLFGAVPALVADVVSYLVSALLLAQLPARRLPPAPAEAGAGAMIREGWQYVTRHPVMGPCLWAATTVNFVCGALLPLAPLFLIHDLGVSPALVGVLIATEGVGTLLGAALTPRLGRLLGTARSLLAAALTGALFALLLPLGHGIAGMALFAVGNAGFALGVVVLSINTRTYRQIESPPHLLARVMATVRFVSWGAIPAGSVAAGALAGAVGARSALEVMAAAAFAPLVVLWLSPVRGRRDLDESQVAAPTPVTG